MIKVNSDNIYDYYGNEDFTGWVEASSSFEFIGEFLLEGSLIYLIEGEVSSKNNQPCLLIKKEGSVSFVWMNSENYHREYGPAIVTIKDLDENTKKSLINGTISFPKLDKEMRDSSRNELSKLSDYYYCGKKVFSREIIEESKRIPFSESKICELFKEHVAEKLFELI